MKSPTFSSPSVNGSDRLTEITLYLTIPESYRQEPLITQLVSRYQLQVNILAATLGTNGGQGQFKLTLIGQSEAINDALAYLEELQVSTVLDQDLDGW
ncbi:NIL domain-containing protein [Synechocystis salina]|uniref:NIL domain-containing protein n=1 Tax=Synechocystis salina LEGE 00031 TaxID=1828736 RepID=A0ABR9VV36_9SYNC|nr:NIL domain-containing protein [Synechocystis salina]MBE9239571.1 NIL domain-containing protein [Synechocystis salina LEGE 00041]MBE9255207.1 NIL domain-containing protein [Synechocystis salina LEGE 00031]